MGRALRKNVWEEIEPVFRQAISRDSDKVVALKLGITPRHARNLKSGECGTGAPVLVMAGMEYPEIRDLLGQYLGLIHIDMKAANALKQQIEQLQATLPAAGDQ